MEVFDNINTMRISFENQGSNDSSPTVMNINLG